MTGRGAPDPIADEIAEAIGACRRLRLVYTRKADGVTSIHEVAPVDIRPGDTPATATNEYLWAWCFAEDKLERHLLDRVRSVEILPTRFEPAEILARWPSGWPQPSTWRIGRTWAMRGQDRLD